MTSLLPLLFANLWSVEPIIEVQHAIGAEWETLFHGIALFGDSRPILVIAIMLFWYTQRERPYQIIAAILMGSAIGSTLKLLVGLPRPSDPEMLIFSTATSPAFPSGHVILATIFWGTLAWYGWIPRWTAVVITLMVMLARVYLGAHFVGDVIFGALIGLTWLLVFHRYIGPWLKRLNPELLARGVVVVLCGSFLVLPIASAFPFGWEIVGALAGAGIGLIIQERIVRFNPRPVSLFWQTAKVPIGIAGILGVVAFDLFVAREILAVELLLYFTGAIWGLLLAPWMFKRLGLGQEPAPASTG